MSFLGLLAFELNREQEKKEEIESKNFSGHLFVLCSVRCWLLYTVWKIMITGHNINVGFGAPLEVISRNVVSRSLEIKSPAEYTGLLTILSASTVTGGEVISGERRQISWPAASF